MLRFRFTCSSPIIRHTVKSQWFFVHTNVRANRYFPFSSINNRTIVQSNDTPNETWRRRTALPMTFWCTFLIDCVLVFIMMNFFSHLFYFKCAHDETSKEVEQCANRVQGFDDFKCMILFFFLIFVVFFSVACLTCRWVLSTSIDKC